MCERSLILLLSPLSHVVRQSGHSVQQLFHSGLTFQDLVGTARSPVVLPPVLACLLAKPIPSPHPIRFRAPHTNTQTFLFFLLVNQIAELCWESKTFLSSLPLHKAS